MRKDNNFILNQSKRQLLLTIVNAIDTRLSIRKIGRNPTIRGMKWRVG